MMRWIIEKSLQFRFLVVIVAAAIMFFGFAQVSAMPVDALPEFSPPVVEVQTEALGLAADEVESLLTVPLEELLSSVPWLETIRSKSVPGLSSIILTFEPGTDIMHARQLVRERLGLTSYTLPHVTNVPTMLQPLSATNRVMMIQLSSNELSPVEMSVLARWNLRPRLMGVPGVANVAIWGQRERQLQVRVDPEELRAQGATLDQVIQTSGNALWFSPLEFLNASYPASGGWIDTPQQRIGIRHVLPISAAEDLARVTVDGTSLRLGDLGEVVEDHPPLIGDTVLKNGDGLLLVVEKFPGANTLEVSRQIDQALDELKPGLPGLDIDAQAFRAASFIELAVQNLGTTLLISAILVVVAFALLLFNWRAALITIVAIASSIMTAAMMLALSGVTMNVMVLAGLVIALGVIIDDATIDVTNIVRRLGENRARNGNSTFAIILKASGEMRSSILFATLIIGLTILPLLFLEGMTGAFFRPLALSYALALFATMVVALTITPVLALILLGNAPLARRESPLLQSLQQGYYRVLARILKTPRVGYIAIVALVVLGLAVMPFIGMALLPEFREPGFLVRWEGEPGTSHPAMTQQVADARHELEAIPGVRSVSGQLGRAVLGDRVVGINSAELWVTVDPAADHRALAAGIQTTMSRYPGEVQNVQTYLGERAQQALTSTNKNVVVRIYGPEIAVLNRSAETVQQALAGIEGVVDLTVAHQVMEQNLEIKVDLDKANRYGLVPGDIRRAASTLVGGLKVGGLYEQQKVFDVTVWSVPQARANLGSIRDLMIDTPGGGQVRLSEVAELRLAPALNAINREANSRYLDVGFNVTGRDFNAVMRDVETRLQNIVFPREYHPELINGYAQQQTATNRMLGVIAAVVVGMLLLLHASFQSWRLVFAFFVTLFAGLSGGMLAIFASDGILSLGALFGFLAVLGLAARQGILLINRYQQLQEQEGEPFGPQLVIRGSLERFVPILITTLTTALAFAPFVWLGAVPGHELIYPMAIVILGGLVTLTLLNLFVIPILHLQFGARTEPAPQNEQLDSQPGFALSADG